ncbi:MAG: hypothetical protein WBC82_04990, partial [Dehalococcoidia bacterium]
MSFRSINGVGAARGEGGGTCSGCGFHIGANCTAVVPLSHGLDAIARTWVPRAGVGLIGERHQSGAAARTWSTDTSGAVGLNSRRSRQPHQGNSQQCGHN